MIVGGWNEGSSYSYCGYALRDQLRAQPRGWLPEKFATGAVLPHGYQRRQSALSLALLRALVTVGLALAWPLASIADPIVGGASVIDADTIEIHGERIRLNGIDAPEARQPCLDADGSTYRCGQVAAMALADFLDAHRPTTCVEVDRDRYKRIVAVCQAGGQDVGAWLVTNGYALDWPRYSRGAYAGRQSEARAKRRGMWAGSFALPWEWRRNRSAALISAEASF